MAVITLKALMKEVGLHPETLNESISDAHIRAIGLFLPSWHKVATYLELSETDLDDVEQEGRDEQDKRLKALQKWKGKFGFKATYRKLVEVLLSLTMADVAEKVCSLLKGTVLSYPYSLIPYIIYPIIYVYYLWFLLLANNEKLAEGWE